jgi:hypothetical protein
VATFTRKLRDIRVKRCVEQVARKDFLDSERRTMIYILEVHEWVSIRLSTVEVKAL